MIYKHLTLFITLFLLSLGIHAQTTSEEKDFVRKLIKKEYTDINDVNNINITEPPYSIELGEDMDRYSVEFSVLTHEDLNDDGVEDYLILRNSMGMLGGNANTNQEYTFYIMKNDAEVENEYSILGYAPFSYNIIDSIEYNNKELMAHISQNFRTYYNEDGELKSTVAHFKYQDGNVYEQSYLTDCQMGQMKDKNIFRVDMPNVERHRNIDMHNYTENVVEEYTANDTIISASLSGCDNLNLAFDISIKNQKETRLSEIDNSLMIDILENLKTTTRYKTILNKVLVDFKIPSYNVSDRVDKKLYDNWTYTITPYRYDSNNKQIRVSIRINNTVNANQTGEWEITTRQK